MSMAGISTQQIFPCGLVDGMVTLFSPNETPPFGSGMGRCAKQKRSLAFQLAVSKSGSLGLLAAGSVSLVAWRKKKRVGTL